MQGEEMGDVYKHVLTLFCFILYTYLWVLNTGITLFKILETLEYKAYGVSHYGPWIGSASLNSPFPLLTWVGQTEINLLVLLTPWKGRAVILSASPRLLRACSSQSLREAFLQQRSFRSSNIFILPLQVSPQPGFLEREKQEERREGLYRLCILGWSLVPLHIMLSFSRMAIIPKSRRRRGFAAGPAVA